MRSDGGTNSWPDTIHRPDNAYVTLAHLQGATPAFQTPERLETEADEGTRTLDLLHGKDAARGEWSSQEPTDCLEC